MPQTWLVVQCYQCKAFQVDQEKKAKKWACKLCGEKQSLQRIYARSHSAKDCRLVVQQYNTARGAVEEDEAERALQAAYLQEEEGGGWAEEEWEQAEERQQQPPQRWQAFQGQDDEEDDGWTVAAPERPAGGKQKRGRGQACGGSKRQRQAQQEQGGHQQDAGGWGDEGRNSGPGWGLAAGGGLSNWQQGWQPPGQHDQKPQQQQWQEQARQPPQQQWQQQAAQPPAFSRQQQQALRDQNGRQQQRAQPPVRGGLWGGPHAPQQQSWQHAPACAPGGGSTSAPAWRQQQSAGHMPPAQHTSQAWHGQQPGPPQVKQPLQAALPQQHQQRLAGQGPGSGWGPASDRPGDAGGAHVNVTHAGGSGKWAGFAQDDDW